MTSKDIKEYGLSIGYSKVGITSADGFPGYVDEVLSRGEKYDILKLTRVNPLSGATPKNIMPEAKSVIVMVWDYFQYDFPLELKAMIGKAYLGRCHYPQPGMVPHARLQLMQDFLKKHGCNSVVDFSVPARWAAAQAGLTTFGRNNFAYTEENGSYIIICTIIADMEFEYDKPTMESKCPTDCDACLKACPTKAIYAPFKLEPRKCVGFSNWIAQDGREGISSFIPHELRESLGGWIHGCDACQDVCPRNQKKLEAPKNMDKFIEVIGKDITLPAILHMDDEYFKRNIEPIMYIYIKDKRYIIRNAAIAMGNSKNKEYIKDLEAELNNPDELIRESVSWALARLKG